MMPDEEIELEDGDYVSLRSTIGSGSFSAIQGTDSVESEVKFGLSEFMNVDGGWCVHVEANWADGEGESVSSLVGMNEKTSKKLVVELARYWG